MEMPVRVRRVSLETELNTLTRLSKRFAMLRIAWLVPYSQAPLIFDSGFLYQVFHNKVLGLAQLGGCPSSI